MWRKGARVRIIESDRSTTPVGIKGTVVYTSENKNGRFMVEFDERMGGNAMYYTHRGSKPGYWWWFDDSPRRITKTDGITIERIRRKNNYY